MREVGVWMNQTGDGSSEDELRRNWRLPLVTALVVLIGALAACGGNEPDPPAPGSSVGLAIDTSTQYVELTGPGADGRVLECTGKIPEGGVSHYDWGTCNWQAPVWLAGGDPSAKPDVIKRKVVYVKLGDGRVLECVGKIPHENGVSHYDWGTCNWGDPVRKARRLRPTATAGTATTTTS